MSFFVQHMISFIVYLLASLQYRGLYIDFFFVEFDKVISLDNSNL